MNQIENDERENYSPEVRKAAIILYLEGNGFRGIARILGQIYSIKIHRIKRLGVKVSTMADAKRDTEKIQVLEMDELYTYVQTKRIESRYGQLLVGTGCVLVHLRWRTGA